MMYVPPAFAVDEKEALALVGDHPFATLISMGPDFHINHMPMFFDESEHCLYGHFASTNPHGHIRTEEYTHCAVFNGPNAYVSAGWYDDLNQVPTWNFQVTHVEGPLTLLERSDDKIEIVKTLTGIHEAGFENPWTLDKLVPEKKERLIGAIVGCRLQITKVTGKSKLSQNKPDEIANLVAGLRAHPQPGHADLIADRMAI